MTFVSYHKALNYYYYKILEYLQDIKVISVNEKKKKKILCTVLYTNVN